MNVVADAAKHRSLKVHKEDDDTTSYQRSYELVETYSNKLKEKRTIGHD